MLIHQTLDQLEQMNLSGMAAGLREQLEQSSYLELPFEDRLGLLVDREVSWRESRRLTTRLKAAKLRHQASVEDIDFRAPRGLDRSVILSLAQAGWVEAHHNVLVTGATGCGKSYLACALAQAAIRQGHTALYVRTPRLLDDLAISRGDGRYHTLLGQLNRAALLVLDDFLLTSATVEQARDLLEVVEDRSQLRSTLVASQLPVEMWHDALADPTLADAILDRLVHNAHRVALKGPSMRRRDPEAPPLIPGPAGAGKAEETAAGVPTPGLRRALR
ncbi:MAG: IS21-like element helper ATPase IstB [Candidatus Dormibacteraeota bacterium]|nr:IS21-like element helper ATPase IstB [Candidatus Dormibacteraeota bacterium]